MEDKPCLDNMPELEAAYQRMSQDHAREIETLEWSEALIGDIDDEVEKHLLFRQSSRETENIKQMQKLLEKILSTPLRSDQN